MHQSTASLFVPRIAFVCESTTSLGWTSADQKVGQRGFLSSLSGIETPLKVGWKKELQVGSTISILSGLFCTTAHRQVILFRNLKPSKKKTLANTPKGLKWPNPLQNP